MFMMITRFNLYVHFICFWPDNKTFQAPLAFSKWIFFGFGAGSVHVLHVCVCTDRQRPLKEKLHTSFKKKKAYNIEI